jgi:hypothetical protein
MSLNLSLNSNIKEKIDYLLNEQQIQKDNVKEKIKYLLKNSQTQKDNVKEKIDYLLRSLQEEEEQEQEQEQEEEDVSIEDKNLSILEKLCLQTKPTKSAKLVLASSNQCIFHDKDAGQIFKTVIPTDQPNNIGQVEAKSKINSTIPIEKALPTNNKPTVVLSKQKQHPILPLKN